MSLGTPASVAPAVLRPARLDDLPALLRLERRCFVQDRLSRRSLQHLLTKGHAVTLVAERPGDSGSLSGYAMALLHGNTSLARLYSLAVDPAARRQGLGRRLLLAVEAAVLAQERPVLRLEVRADNAQAIALYRENGYRSFATIPDYYEDGAPALRLEKRLAGGARPELTRVPYYPQSLEFTCGPASLMMAMRAFDACSPFDRHEELRLWRESTSIFMTSGHGGCGPLGLALAAWRRGFRVELYVSEAGPLFVETVRSAEKKEVIRLVHEDFQQQAEAAGIPRHGRGLNAAETQRLLEDGALPLVLISSWRLYRERNPHWVLVTGADRHFLYLHDPYVDWEEHKSETDSMNLPVTRREFDRMTRWGATGLRAAVVVKGRRS